jgi:pyruvate/2-oxoglutarate dehydrogenase complex dihydrolipoamide dehydrogenase (E3) component
MLVIGSGPAGKSAAIQSAKLGKTAALDWINRVGA